MSPLESPLQQNLSQVHRRIASACQRAGRAPATVTLVAVTKTARLEWVEELVRLGVRRLGESRPQQLVERAARIPDAEWHLVGHLQRNKVRSVLPYAALIHSVDSLRLLERINEVAADLQLSPRVLLQVNVSGEASKQGFAPEALLPAWDRVTAFSRIRIEGLMTMAPDFEDAELARPTFRGLRDLRDQLRCRIGPEVLPQLSMGMSHDMEVAIEEGATLVRIGSALFEGLG